MTARTRLFMTVDAVGGVWTYAVELAAALAPLGYETSLALLGPAASPAQRRRVAAIPAATLIETGLALDWLAQDAATVAATAEHVARLAHEARADIVQLNQPALATARLDRPVVVVAHSCVASWWAAVEGGAMPDAFAWQTALVREGLARADAVVAPSHAFADELRRLYPLPGGCRVVPNSRSPMVSGSREPRDFAFTAGRLWDKGKNVATLDRTAAALAVPLTAAGPLAGPDGERIAFANLDTRGAIGEDALAAILAERPVFVSAAKYEPFGLAVLEAALAGCALVLSDIATLRELWGDAASFVAPDDADGFARAIAALIADPDERARRGDLARAAAARFTPARQAADMVALYRSLGVATRESVAA